VGSQGPGPPKIEISADPACAQCAGLAVTAAQVTIRGVAVDNFQTSGISLGVDPDPRQSGQGDLIIGCYVGAGLNGASKTSGNSSGIIVQSSYNTIGGVSTSYGDLVSGNSLDGIDITGANAVGNYVIANSVGVQIAGLAALANKLDGISIENDASNNTVWSSLVSGNGVIGGNGAGISVNNSNNNILISNTIGLNGLSNAAIANTQSGIALQAQASNNTIVGNLVSGNNGSGILVDGVNNNLLSSNTIGLDGTGYQAIANGQDGITLRAGPQNNQNNTISSNLISGNEGNGVLFDGAGGNVLSSNDIGLNGAGAGAVQNGANGIALQTGAANNKIQTSVISGNAGNGVLLSGAGVTKNAFLGNIIGLDPTGQMKIGNGSSGIDLEQATNNTIGSLTVPANGNVISGNTVNGVSLNGTGNILAGNTIGLNAQGSAYAANGRNGVSIGGNSNVIGSQSVLAKGSVGANVISGNGFNGVFISGNSNTIAGNYIGTDSTGENGIGNARNGIYITTQSSSNVIGLAGTGGPSNVISANGLKSDGNGSAMFGIFLAGAGANTIQGNYIGTDLNGTSVLGNDGSGIELAGPPNGTITILKNVISGNGVGKAGATIGYGIDDPVSATIVVDIENNTIGLDKNGQNGATFKNITGSITPWVKDGDANGDTVKGNSP
jgi:titin